ncbi:MAG TPA: cytochrome C [Spirochaetota bacterium]|nr:cytochrome C [Spirochaetota bacterium]HSA14170.1 cytochrome C [Spirochaetota bacterium]
MKKNFFLTMALVGMTFCASTTALAGTADHSKFPELNKKFNKPEDVTRECLKCHNLAGKDIMKTSHWLWSRKTDKMPGRQGQMIEAGKKNIINNFCIALTSNEPRCTSCHIGYGWKDRNFDFTDESKIDCLVCHEQTGTYKKFPAGAGYPAPVRTLFPGNNQWYDPPDYTLVARNVGRPKRSNCGVCHFYGGGGDAVKHGALDSALGKPVKDVDVHMGTDGGNMVCVDCHVADRHDIKGQLYSVSSDNLDRLSCERCHTAKPHTQKLFVDSFEAKKEMGYDIFKNKLYERKKPDETFINRILDKHIDRISCQACHINLYSTQKTTKIWWDWSKAGELNAEGKPVKKKDKDGNIIYDGQKGEFRLAKNAIPEYRWFNGEVGHLLEGDKIDPSNVPVIINEASGACGAKDSKVWPFKIMRGIQPYDTETNMLIIPKLFGKKGSGAYWSDWDWQKASEAGMKAAGLPFSGKIGWIETEMNWPLTHLVLEKKKALSCNDCHSRESRLKNLEACWIPGRDRNLPLDILGMLAFFGAMAGVSVHGLVRYRKSGKQEE